MKSIESYWGSYKPVSSELKSEGNINECVFDNNKCPDISMYSTGDGYKIYEKGKEVVSVDNIGNIVSYQGTKNEASLSYGFGEVEIDDVKYRLDGYTIRKGKKKVARIVKGDRVKLWLIRCMVRRKLMCPHSRHFIIFNEKEIKETLVLSFYLRYVASST